MYPVNPVILSKNQSLEIIMTYNTDRADDADTHGFRIRGNPRYPCHPCSIQTDSQNTGWKNDNN